MTGKELIQELDKRIGTNYTFGVGDVVWNGTLREYSKDCVSTKYTTGNAIFIIYPDKNYKFRHEDRSIFIEVK